MPTPDQSPTSSETGTKDFFPPTASGNISEATSGRFFDRELSVEVWHELDEPFPGALSNFSLKTLTQQELTVNRDLLVLGGDRLQRFTPFSQARVKILAAYLLDLNGAFKLFDQPPMAYAAQICEDISQVPIHVVMAGRLLDLTGWYANNMRVTLQDALNNTSRFQALVPRSEIVIPLARQYNDGFMQAKEVFNAAH